jgi:hypothetical protein
MPMMRRKIINTLISFAGAYCIAPLLHAQRKQTPLPSPIDTTVCEGVGDGQRFDGKKVRFIANFRSDGIEHSVLTDSKCSRGIIPFVPDEFENHQDIQALDRALKQGRHGTMDKHIVATFTGRFVRQTKPSSRPRFILAIERIENLQVSMVDLKPHVPR